MGVFICLEGFVIRVQMCKWGHCDQSSWSESRVQWLVNKVLQTALMSGGQTQEKFSHESKSILSTQSYN